MELDEGSRRTVALEAWELREGAVVTRPLEEADDDKEEVEENFLTTFLAALFFSVEDDVFFAGRELDGV